MSIKRTKPQITLEIEKLKALSPRIPQTTFFGESNLVCIDAEIAALDELLDEDEIHERRQTAEDEGNEDDPFFSERAESSACEAARWLSGDSDEKPSDGWTALVKAKQRK